MNEVTKTTVDRKDYELDEKKAVTITQSFSPMVSERDILHKEYTQLLELEMTPEVCARWSAIGKKLVKVRTGISKNHKAQKHLFYQAGLFCDAIKNAETLPVEQMEEKALEKKKHYENIEKARIAKVAEARTSQLMKLGSELFPADLGNMDDDVWDNYIKGVEQAKKLKDEEEAETERLRLKAIEDEKKERERIRLENEKLKEEREAQRVKLEKEEAERARLAKIEAEKQRKKDEEQKLALEKVEAEKKEIREKAVAEQKEKAELQRKELAKVEAEKKELREKAEAEQRKKDEEEKRSKDSAHKSKIKNGIYTALCELTSKEDAKAITKAMIDGNIPSVKIQY